MPRTNPIYKMSETPEGPSRTARKRNAVIGAATELFFQGGYMGANMDEIAAAALVSKQTAYKYFASKEALFVEIVTRKCKEAGDKVIDAMRAPTAGQDARAYLFDHAYRQLTIVMTPELMQLRRLVIGEVNRFPELARALYEYGPKRAIGVLTAAMSRLNDLGLISASDPLTAASHFNWLVMGQPVNQAMLLGDEAIPKPEELHRHAVSAVNVFLAAYGSK